MREPATSVVHYSWDAALAVIAHPRPSSPVLSVA